MFDDLDGSKLRKINLEDFKTMLEVLPIPVDVVDTELNILYMNDAIKRKVGRDATGEKCFEVYKDDKQQCELCPLKNQIKDGNVKTIETEGAFNGKTLKIIHKAIELSGKKYVLEIFEDITESITDELTGSFNRRKLKHDLKEELSRAERYNNCLSILMLDIDWFKKYNDFHGHQKGDALLVELVDVLGRNLRVNDKLYRYGGEEFVVLLPETDEEQAIRVAEKIRSKVEINKFEGAEESQPNMAVSVSIGISSNPKNGATPADIIFAADSALYDAKAAGKNTIKIAKK